MSGVCVFVCMCVCVWCVCVCVVCVCVCGPKQSDASGLPALRRHFEKELKFNSARISYYVIFQYSP